MATAVLAPIMIIYDYSRNLAVLFTLQKVPLQSKPRNIIIIIYLTDKFAGSFSILNRNFSRNLISSVPHTTFFHITQLVTIQELIQLRLQTSSSLLKRFDSLHEQRNDHSLWYVINSVVLKCFILNGGVGWIWK